MTGEPDWDAAEYDRHARFVSKLSGRIEDWLAPQEGERILDLCCGDGELTARLADSGAHMVGVDNAPDMIEAARRRGVDAHLADATQLSFEEEFDCVFSNSALHWISDQRSVIDGVRQALRPGGRFVAEMGGHGNVAAIATALRASARQFGGDESKAVPWTFPTVADYTQLLENGGFIVDRIELMPRPTALPTDIEGWMSTFSRGYLRDFDEATRQQVIDTVVDLLRPALCAADGTWTADYVRLRFRAHLPG